MLDNKQIQLISKLKQQPRLGSGPTALLDELTNVFKKVFASYEAGASAVIQKNVFAFLATEVQNLTNSLTVLEQRNTSLQDGFNKNIKGAAELGKEIGFEVVELIYSRKLNTSSQQMKNLKVIDKILLRETIIVLRKKYESKPKI